MKNKKGFTLVEVMIGVAILAILAAIIVPAITGKGLPTPTATARITFSSPEVRNTQTMIQQVDIYQQQYGISEFDLPLIMRNENQKEWYFPK